MTAVRGAAELARQRTCLGGTESQHESGESKSSAGIWQHNLSLFSLKFRPVLCVRAARLRACDARARSTHLRAHRRS